MTIGPYTSRGALVQNDRSVRFAVWAPRARSVSVRLRGPEIEGDHGMAPVGDGVFEVTLQGVPPGTKYVYRLDGEQEVPDPVSRHQPDGVHGPSAVVAPQDFSWSDDEWSGLDWPTPVFYEVHVGTATRPGTFAALRKMLPRLREVGINAIQLMPVAQFPGERNWGYDGVFPYAPQNTYGGPEQLRAFVNEAHRQGFGVYLDVVYNHLGPEGNVLGQYGPYFTDRYKTPWGAAINFDGPESDEVRRYFIENAVYWVTEYHIDGLRLDAVHAICDFSAYHILDELGAAVHGVAAEQGRHIHVIPESDLNDPRLIRSHDRGGYNLNAQWNDDFHHAVHAAVTEERTGYYVDFDGLAAVEKALTHRYVLDGVYSRFRRRRHGAPARDLPADRFIAFIQNHDQVGNRAGGERLAELVSFEKQKIAAVMLLASPYVPLLFMGEEYGETSPFQYFVSHTDRDLVEAVRRGRREEFQAFGWGEDIPDPQAVETLDRSRIHPDKADAGRHAMILALYRDLLALRRRHPALRPGTAEVAAQCDVDAGWLTWALIHPGGRHLLAGVNLTSAAVSVDPGVSAPAGPVRRLLLSTDDAAYGGSRASDSGTNGDGETGGGPSLRVPPEAAVVYEIEVT